MTNEELSALLPDIEMSINAYEKGARKEMPRAELSTVEALALSMQVSPMMAMTFAMNAMDSASLTPEEIETEYKSQNNIINNIKKEEPSNEILQNSFFDQDCEIVGSDSWTTNEKISEGEINIGGIKIPKKVGRRFTNPVKVKLKVNPLFVGHLVEERSGKTIADCLDCEVNYTSEFMYPSIELLWEFEKLLKGLLDAIKLIEKNLDPISMYNDICKLKAFIGTNFLCPSMMFKINLLLPTLFMKYSMDLGKISIDLNFFLGGIIKVAISAIATFLENIRALIIPFIDCALNAANSVKGYIKSVASAIAAGVDQVSDLVNKSGQILHKAGLMVAEAFKGSDPTKVYERSGGDGTKLKQAFQTINDLHAKTVKELNQILLLSGKKRETSQEFIEAKDIIENNLRKSRFLLDSLPVKYGGTYEGKFKNNPLINAIWTMHNNDDKFWNMDGETFQSVLIEYLQNIVSINDFSIKKMKRERETNEYNTSLYDPRYPEGSQQYKFQDTVDTLNILETVTKEYKKAQKNQKESYEENKDTLNYKMAAREKKFFDYENMINKEIPNPGVNKNVLYNFLKTRYSFNLENSFVNHEYPWAKDFKKTAKKYSSGFLDGIVELLDDYVIRYLKIAKKEVNDFFGNIINILKNLNLMLDQNAFTQLQIIGEIMQLTHVIRAFRLIVKLIDEGFEGCDKVNKDKEQERILRKALEEVSDNQASAEVVSLNGETNENNEKSENHYLRIYNKKNNNSHLVSIKECSDATEELRANNSSLDYMYKFMEESMI